MRFVYTTLLFLALLISYTEKYKTIAEIVRLKFIIDLYTLHIQRHSSFRRLRWCAVFTEFCG